MLSSHLNKIFQKCFGASEFLHKKTLTPKIRRQFSSCTDQILHSNFLKAHFFLYDLIHVLECASEKISQGTTVKIFKNFSLSCFRSPFYLSLNNKRADYRFANKRESVLSRGINVLTARVTCYETTQNFQRTAKKVW